MHSKEKMTYAYNAVTSRKDNVSSNCLLVSHTLSFIINLFVSTFLVAHIHGFSDGIFNYIFNVSIFSMVTYASTLITYFLVSYLVQKTNRVWIYRLGIAMRTALVIVVIFCGKDIAKMLPLAGLLNGVSMGFYWSSFNVIRQEMVSRKSIGKYMVVTKVLDKAVNIIVPITLGAIIDLSSYATASIYVLVVCAIQIIFSFGVHAKRPTGSKFHMIGYFKKMKANPEYTKRAKLIYFTYIGFGFSSVLGDLVTICIMMQYGSNFSLGTITSVFSIIAVAILLMMSKWTKPGKRTVFMVVMPLLYVGVAIIFALYTNIVTVILYKAGYVVLHTIVDTIGVTYRNSNLKEAGLYSEIDEHQMVIECILDSVRVLTFAILLAVGLLQSLVLFKILLVLFVLGYMITAVGLIIYEKRYALSPLKVEGKDDKLMKIDSNTSEPADIK